MANTLNKPAPLDEGDLREVPLEVSKLDPQERPRDSQVQAVPGLAPTHASPAQQNKDQLSLEQHPATDEASRVHKNPQFPGHQQHQAPGSAPRNHVKQQQGIDTLIDNM
ncbi:hypothetical protein ACIDE9_06735 [Methylophilus sp. 'Pure River']|uniref:hypothetical protein n=1 Tax=Methylophilus sp. 'Pure River' TaxID=3377117 RepID=UPI00398E6AE4